MSAIDLVLGVYSENKHLQDIVLIPGSEINQEPRMEVCTARRNPNCDLVIQHPSIHGFHFELEVDKVSRRVWVTNLTLMGKLSIAKIVIRPQCTDQFYPGEILKLEVIPSVSGQEEGSCDSKHQEAYVDGSTLRATQQLCEKIIEVIDRLQDKWKQDEIATGSTVENDTTAMRGPLLPRTFTPQCMVKPKEGGSGISESLLNSLQRAVTREIVTSLISDQGERVEEISGCTKKELVPTLWKGSKTLGLEDRPAEPKHRSIGTEKGQGQIIQEDNLLQAWGQAQSKEGGSDTCLILAPLRTAEGLVESSRAEPTSGVSSSWAHRLPPDRLMSLLSDEVSLDRESREQQAATWRTAKDGCKPKE
ncbi:hypothetical protein EJ110_NYTH20565 [Nymphaea thermarum]|nr:hypothetical protein EJ110_NYTH20565 [Nymphaea thermarum]